jgi:aspartate racemase
MLFLHRSAPRRQLSKQPYNEIAQTEVANKRRTKGSFMKKVGIIGGIGPVSTLDYYEGIVNAAYEQADTGDYPELVISSINMTKMLALAEANDWKAVTNLLVNAIGDLTAAGAELGALASNTPHIVFDEIQKRVALPLVSIVEETCKYAQAQGCKKVLVLGTRFTMGSSLYSKAFQEYGIAAVVPSKSEQELIHSFIVPHLENGIVVPEDKQKMLELTNRLLLEQGADALVLGCTELPLMIQEGDLDTLLLNTTQLHIAAIVRELL